MTGKGAALGGVAELWQSYRARLGVIGFLLHLTRLSVSEYEPMTADRAL